MTFGIQLRPMLAHFAPISTLIGSGAAASVSGCQNLQSGRVQELPYRHGLSWVLFLGASSGCTFSSSFSAATFEPSSVWHSLYKCSIWLTQKAISWALSYQTKDHVQHHYCGKKKNSRAHWKNFPWKKLCKLLLKSIYVLKRDHDFYKKKNEHFSSNHRFSHQKSYYRIDFTEKYWAWLRHTVCHSVEITEIYSHAFFAKISWKQRIHYLDK